MKAILSADIGERACLSGHHANMHIWWGRTPISSTAVILKAAMLDYDPSREEPIKEQSAAAV